MNINLKLNKNFQTQLNKLSEEFGEDFEKINGFADNNFDLSSFIDNFIDSTNNANATIDANANIQSKDICNLISEIPKPYLKLLGFNKVFYEIQKRYEFKTAKDWIRAEWKGDIFTHNSSDISFRPYCYSPNQCLEVKYKEQTHYLSFAMLYDLVEEEEEYDRTIDQMAKFPKDLYVLDYEDENVTYTQVIRLVKHVNDKPMRTIRLKNGLIQTVTEDHPIITSVGDKPANSVTSSDSVLTIPSKSFDNSISFINIEDNLKYNPYKKCHKVNFGTIPLNKEIGWLIGFILAEGNWGKSSLFFSQKEGDILDKAIALLDKYNIPYSKNIKERDVYIVKILACPLSKWFNTDFVKSMSKDKALPSDYIHYSHEALNGIIAGLIDGDGSIDGGFNRHCAIRINSETLLLQISNYLSYLGVQYQFRIPFKYNYENSFKQNYPMYGLGFNITYPIFRTIGSEKINSRYIPLKREMTKRILEDNYGITNIESNTIFIDECPIVYDITTETGHFICNNILSHNCYNYDLRDLAEKGMYFISNLKTEPAKHLSTFCDHVLELVSWVSNRSSGGCGLANVLMWFWWFWHRDCEQDHYLKSPEYYRDQCFQKFIFDLSMPYLRVSQSAYTTLSIFDRTYCEEMFGGYEFPDGTFFIDYIEEFIEFEKAFMNKLEEMREKNVHTYPVVTYSLVYRDNAFADEEFAKWCCQRNMKYADANFMISDSTGVMASCCRLLNDTTKRQGFVNSIGGGDLGVGSVSVITLNLAGLAYQSSDETDFINRVIEKTHLIIKSNDTIRHIIQRNIEKNLLPNYSFDLIKLDGQFCTIGINGIVEAAKHFGYYKQDNLGYWDYTNEGLNFVSKILDKITAIKESYNLGYHINIEQCPRIYGTIAA